MEITNLPARILGLDACSASVMVKMVHLPHKEGCSHATEYLEWVHVNIAGPMHVPSARGRLYLYVAVDDYTHAVYTWLLFLKSEVPEAFKAFRAATENGSGKRLHEVMTDNVCELLMGKMRDICKSSYTQQYCIILCQTEWPNVP